ncbi:MAG: Fur family transcriptional regulator [Bacillota bacterium]|nr:transcriptional repressor [Clostridia bacterium]
MDRVKKLSSKLQAQGQKITKQRRAILEVLAESDKPLTAEEVYLLVRGRKENTSLTTVYRNLKKLLAAGLITREGFHDDKAQFQLLSDPHCHNLVCLNCRKVVKITECPLASFAKTVGEREGFTITEHRMELYGYCSDCLQRAKKE